MSLSSDLKKFAQLTKAKQERVVKSSFIQLGNEMEFKSPVKSGRFKDNWIGAVGSVNTMTTDSNRNAVGALSTMLSGFRICDNYVLYYTNSLPYAQALEYGHSEQAPGGMVRLTARRWNSIVNTQIRANQ